MLVSMGSKGKDPEPTRSTARLFQMAKEGDQEARSELFHRYLKRLEPWARGRLPAWARRNADTGDVVQQTLLKVLRNLDRLELAHSDGFRSYVSAALTSVLLDEIRAALRTPIVEDGVTEREASGPPLLEILIGRELLTRYDEALSRMRLEHRTLVTLRLELGFTHKEIAEELGGLTPDAARMRTNRAILSLAQQMRTLRTPGVPAQ